MYINPYDWFMSYRKKAAKAAAKMKRKKSGKNYENR